MTTRNPLNAAASQLPPAAGPFPPARTSSSLPAARPAPPPPVTDPTPDGQPLSLHIDRLTLHGFANINRDRLHHAIAQELTRLFTEQGIPPTLTQNQQIGKLDGGSFSLPGQASTQAIATHIAQSIYQGLSHG
ncbi:MAG: hypothetical protein F6K04_22260 [Leptolyngbya sp. SIO4C5]|nr:hypothetical protein [Leptolyngbya sp. SIO4C5]